MASRPRHPRDHRQRRTLRTIAAGLLGSLAVLSLALVDDAAVPLPPWRTDLIDQPGQRTVYNDRENGGAFGLPVEVGDFDGDGRPDLVVAAMGAQTGPAADRVKGGEVYVYRGDGTIDGVLDRGSFDPAKVPGLTIRGARIDDLLGTEVATGDVNGDGLDDLIIGAQNYDGPRFDRGTCGGVFVILGSIGRLADGGLIDLAYNPDSPPPGVITIIGERAGDRLGVWVEAADLDGDGIDDLLLGGDQSSGADTTDEKIRVGMVAVIYGRAAFPALIDLASATPEDDTLSLIYGRDHRDHFGSTLHARDLDGDGWPELMMSAAMNRLSADQGDRTGGGNFPAEGFGGGDGPSDDIAETVRFDAGEVTIIFSSLDGAHRLPPRIDLAAELPAKMAARVAVIHGALVNSTAGEELATGDLDGDGVPELIVGALAARNPEGDFFAGAAYVIYGANTLRGQTLDLATPTENLPPGIEIAEMFGTAPLQLFGDTISIGDFNHDGLEDVAIGVPVSFIRSLDNRDPGFITVLIGEQQRLPPRFIPELAVPGEGPPVILIRGADEIDKLSYSMKVIDYDGDGYDDIFTNAMHGGGFENAHPLAGDAYLVSGYHLTAQSLEVASLSPERAEVGHDTTVMIHGCGFTTSADTRVRVGEREASAIEVRSGTELTAVFPAGDSPGSVTVTVETRHGVASLTNGFTHVTEPEFIRGDSNRNLGVAVDDAIFTLRYLFLRATASCLDAHDTDDNGTVTITDPVRTLLFLFTGGQRPAAPFPAPGRDPTEDGLGCV